MSGQPGGRAEQCRQLGIITIELCSGRNTATAALERIMERSCPACSRARGRLPAYVGPCGHPDLVRTLARTLQDDQSSARRGGFERSSPSRAQLDKGSDSTFGDPARSQVQPTSSTRNSPVRNASARLRKYERSMANLDPRTQAPALSIDLESTTTRSQP